MNEAEFMRQLSLELAGLSGGERQEILEDFSEHFRAGRQSGRTEAEIAAHLGNPRTLARQFLHGHAVKRHGGTIFTIFAALFVDLIMVGVVIGAGASLLAFYPAWAITVLAGLITAAACAVDAAYPLGFVGSSLHPILGVLLALLIANAGALLFLVNHILFKKFCVLCGKFYRWNLKMIRGE